MGTASPQAAANGATRKLVLSPTPPVECLSTAFLPSRAGENFSPESRMASASARVSSSVSPLSQHAISHAASCSRGIEPEAAPATTNPISRASSRPPSRFRRMMSIMCSGAAAESDIDGALKKTEEAELIPTSSLFIRLCASSREPHQLLRFMTRPQDGDARKPSAHHRNFVAAVQARAALAVLENLVRQLGLVFHNAKAILEKEVRNTREQAHGLDAVLFRFVNQRIQNAAARTLALGLRPHHNRAHLRQMRTIKMQRPAAQKNAAVGFSHREVADILADLRERALEQRAVTGQ